MAAVERARGGEGPTLIEARTYRHRGHYEGDMALVEQMGKGGDVCKKEVTTRICQDRWQSLRGARAIGREVSESLGSRGAAVEVFDLAPAQQTVEAIRAGGGQAEYQIVDVTDEEAIKAGLEQVMDRNGRVDILINNAGLFAGIPRRPFWGSSWPNGGGSASERGFQLSSLS